MANNSNKAKRLTGINPMAYMGVEPLAPVDFVTDDRDPTTSDYSNFNIGQLWLNTSSYDVFMLVNKGLGVATWNQLSGGTGDLVSLTGNSGGAVMADAAHNINVVGDGTTIIGVGNPGTNTITFNVIAGVFSSSFLCDVVGTQNPVLPNGSGQVAVTSSDSTITTTGNTNSINLQVRGGQPVTNYTVPNGTTPVVPTAAGNVSLTSTDGSVTITGGLNTINFASSVTGVVNYTNVNTSPYVVQASDIYISVDCSGGPITLQFPNAATAERTYTIKDRTGSAGTNNITVTTVGGVVNIDGAATFVMNTAYEAINLMGNGTTYEVW